MLKPGCPYLPLKAPEDEEEIQESTSLRLAAAKEISVDTAVAAVLSELSGMKRRVKNNTEDFSLWIGTLFSFAPEVGGDIATALYLPLCHMPYNCIKRGK